MTTARYAVEGYSRIIRTQRELVEAFETVQNETNWKFPISKVVPMGKFNKDLLMDAIVHFTGSVPTFTMLRPERGSLDLRDSVLVEAAGYYAAVGA